MRYAYPCRLTAETEGGFSVAFRDLPDALTGGDDRADALAAAADCLDEAVSGRLRRGDALPAPSKPERGEDIVPVPALTAAKAALAQAMTASGLTRSELGRRLGIDPKDVRRLLDPLHQSRMESLQDALAKAGALIVIESREPPARSPVPAARPLATPRPAAVKAPARIAAKAAKGGGKRV